MKKKQKILVLAGICAINLLSWEAQAMYHEQVSVIETGDNLPTGYEKILLHGTLATNAGPNAIVAGASDDAVYIGFNQSFGNVNISIYNGMGGLVYSTVVNTNVQQVVIIPFNAAASGSYIVELSNANGYAEGEFDHD